MAGGEIYIARFGIWIGRALGDTAGFAADLDTEVLGFQIPEAVRSDSAVQAAGVALADAGSRLSSASTELEAAITSGDEGDLARGLSGLAEGIYLFTDALSEMVGRIETVAATLPPGERDAVEEFAGIMTRKVFDYLVLSLLMYEHRKFAFLLKLLGLADLRVMPSTSERPYRYVLRDLKLERLKDLIRDPVTHLTNAHRWGTAEFDPADIMDTVLSFYQPYVAIESDKEGDDAFLKIGGFHWCRDSSVNPPGLMLDYSSTIAQNFDERVELSPEWGIDFKSTLTINGGAIFRLRPPFAFSVAPKTGNLNGFFSFMANRNPDAQGMTIIDGNDMLRLTADNAGIGGELTIGASTSGTVNIDPDVVAELKGLRLALGSEGSDSFLASLLAEADIQGVLDLALGWKLNEGLVIRSAGGLEMAIPMHQNLGVARLETLYLILKIRDDGSLVLETSAGITGQIGPLSAAVERLGVESEIAFSDGADAGFGPLDLNLRFKPPNGIGLAVDAGLVRGGGYLSIDCEKGEYTGELELVFSDFLSLKAIGLISTRMPDGLEGFSLLIIITAEFGTPIQLGYGFVLVGVGGLLGLNRTMKLEVMAEGVRTGAIDSVMFPRDVIANASRIISDLKRFFPPLMERFLVGPMAKLGWGTPTLITASIGIVIEIPPGNIAIIGVLRCALPDEDAALLVLQVKFIGALEPTKKRLWFSASLFGSRVLFMTLDGEMGLFIAWGDKPNFVLSVGGFHPRFTPPSLPFAVPRRIALSILNESYARIRIEGYFAVTSNTAQFGAQAELYFGLDVFSIEGHLGFDALFQFSPFYFIITFSSSMSVTVFGAGLFSILIRGQLEGTSPWHVEGEGVVQLLFWELDVPFSYTWGDCADTVLQEIAAMPVLKAEFEKHENWVSIPPAGSQLSVSIRKIDETTGLVLHPLGVLRISQRAVPLDLSIHKIGNRKISDIEKAILRVNTTRLRQEAEVKEPFALAQYIDLDASAKLSAPGYERQVAGVDISVNGTDTRTNHAVKRIVLHEMILIDNNFKEGVIRFFEIGKRFFRLLLGSNATARSVFSRRKRLERVPFFDRVTTSEPGFVIASMRDNSVREGTVTFTSQARCSEELTAQIRDNPDMAGQFHVIPAVEARRVA